LKSSGHEPFPELDRQLRLDSMPLLRWALLLGGDVAQRQVDQLGRRLVARKVPFVADRLTDLAMQVLDRIGGVDDLAHLGREGEKRDHLGAA